MLILNMKYEKVLLSALLSYHGIGSQQHRTDINTVLPIALMSSIVPLESCDQVSTNQR